PRDRLHDVPAGFPSRAVRLRIRGGGRHARRTDSDHDLQRSTLPDRLGHVTVLAESMAGSRPRTPAGRLVAALNHWVIHIALGLIGVIWLVPTIGLLVTSFRPRSDIQSTGWWDIFNLHLTLDNYRQVLEAQGMLQAFLSTVFIAVPSTLLPLVICAMAAYAFSWMRFPFRDSLFLIVVGLLMVPVQVAFIPVLTGMRELFPDLQLTRGYGAIWLAHTAFALPFGIFLLRNFFITLPP